MKRLVIALSLLLCLIISVHGVVLAQGVPTSFGIELSVSSQNPTPGQSITITARSYSTDITAAKITWSVNGKIAQSSNGLTTYTVTAPALGKKLAVDVSALTTDGVTIRNSITITSGSIDLFVETDGYVPPFFLGKLPPVFQNTEKIIAIPHLADANGVEYDPKTLVYSWKKNDQVLEDQSGYGKQSMSTAGGLVPRPYQITVTASTRDHTAQAMSILNVQENSPTVGFYTNDSLYGPLFNQAVGDTIRIGAQRETGILSVPYGFSQTTNTSNGLTYTWLINGVEHTDLSSNNSIVLRAPDGQAGSSEIELEVKSAANALQDAKNSFSSVFSQESGTTTTDVTL